MSPTVGAAVRTAGCFLTGAGTAGGLTVLGLVATVDDARVSVLPPLGVALLVGGALCSWLVARGTGPPLPLLVPPLLLVGLEVLLVLGAGRGPGSTTVAAVVCAPVALAAVAVLGIVTRRTDGRWLLLGGTGHDGVTLAHTPWRSDLREHSRPARAGDWALVVPTTLAGLAAGTSAVLALLGP